MWGIDVSHTAHTGAQTGIQHVCRDLLACFAGYNEAVPLVYDPYWEQWRDPDHREHAYLYPDMHFLPAGKRSGKWSPLQKLRGRLGRRLGMTPSRADVGLLFCPELFDFRRDTAIFNGNWQTGLPKVAYFYDAIPLKFPKSTPIRTVQRFPDYLRALARFDHVTCISAASERDLHQCWMDLGIVETPATSVTRLGLPLGRVPAEAPKTREPVERPVILMVGTLEGRKNHLALLGACESLWKTGRVFELRLAGMLNRETGEPAARRIRELQAAGFAVVWEGAVSNKRLLELYREADAFIYPSLYEGFGIPIVEALAHGLPTVLTQKGALAEFAGEGGCLPCEDSAEEIAGVLGALLSDPDLYRRLAREAADRPVRSMRETATELRSLFQSLGTSPSS